MTGSQLKSGEQPEEIAAAASTARRETGSHVDTQSLSVEATEIRIRGGRLWRALEAQLHRLDRLVERWLPGDLNPFTQAGAIANTTFIIALISGVLLLFWYVPSVHEAYSSLEEMKENFFAQLVRSVHRYSSDACMLFVLYHGLKVFLGGRFGGARWVAWVTGAAILFLLWLDGWLGYWLVWDETGSRIAQGTSKLADSLGLLPTPLARGFVADDMVNSTLFFIGFFFHLCIPLAIGIGLWMHLIRINKSKLLTSRNMTIAITISMLAISIVAPAYSGKPAKMLTMEQEIPLDFLYLYPMYITDRLNGGMLWLAVFVGTLGFVGIPWWFTRRRAVPSEVNPDLCDGCEQCFNDCPYNAISMATREDGTLLSVVHANKCIACGICTASCQRAAIELPDLKVREVRRQIDAWFDPKREESNDALAFLCVEGSGKRLDVDANSGHCDHLPGYRVIKVPCAGWIHPELIERAQRRGASGVLISACDTTEPFHRLGVQWAMDRLSGARTPSLRKEKVDESRLLFVTHHRNDFEVFLGEALAFREKNAPSETKRAPKAAAKVLAGAVVLVLLSLIVYGLSATPYSVPSEGESELVATFWHAGAYIDEEKKADDEDLPAHMRGVRQEVRSRAPVRMRVLVDGVEILNKSYEPAGLFSDRNSVAVERLPITAGSHQVGVYIGETNDSNEWSYHSVQTIEVEASKRVVVRFEKAEGFQWKQE